jgi:hypothetical protein
MKKSSYKKSLKDAKVMMNLMLLFQTASLALSVYVSTLEISEPEKLTTIGITMLVALGLSWTMCVQHSSTVDGYVLKDKAEKQAREDYHVHDQES